MSIPTDRINLIKPVVHASAFDKKDWVFELAWEIAGFRAMLCIDGSRAWFLNKDREPMPERFHQLAEDIRQELHVTSTILDGVIGVLDPDTRFFSYANLLSRNPNHMLTYVGLDVMFLEGCDLTKHKLLERRDRLTDLPRGSMQPTFQYSCFGTSYMKSVIKRRLPGIVAKNITDTYTDPGDWRLIQNPAAERPREGSRDHK